MSDSPDSIIVTLYLPKAKGGRNILVRGRSGKGYLFTADRSRRGLPVRHYTSVADFEREHLDIATNHRNNLAVSLLLGNPDPAPRALEAVRALVENPLRSNAGVRLKTLLEIATLAASAADALQQQGTKPSDGPTPVPEPSFTPAADPVPEAEADGEVAAVEVEPVASDDVPTGKFDEAYLHSLPIDELKELAKGKTRAQTRQGIINVLMGKE